jgi:hypothetical protein
MFLVLALDPTLDLTLVLTLDPTLIPTLHIAQKRKASWLLWYWRPLMDKLVTWDLFIIASYSY